MSLAPFLDGPGWWLSELALGVGLLLVVRALARTLLSPGMQHAILRRVAILALLGTVIAGTVASTSLTLLAGLLTLSAILGAFWQGHRAAHLALAAAFFAGLASVGWSPALAGLVLALTLPLAQAPAQERLRHRGGVTADA